MPEATSPVNVVFGSMTFGKEGTDGARISNVQDAGKLLDLFKSHGHSEVDTARVYAEGTTEGFLRELDLPGRGLVVETKLLPVPGKISHQPADVRKHLEISLKELGVDHVDLWYLHGPDRSLPFEETLREVNELHKEGKFSKLGLSNYAGWEVARMVETCRREGWIVPTHFQIIYNAVHRGIEYELIPCVRHYGLKIYAFNPLAGGFFNRTSADQAVEKGSRFDSNTQQGKMYLKRYEKPGMWRAGEILREVAEKEGLTVNEILLRWIARHSELSSKYGDAIIIGASSLKHLEENLKDLEKPNLPQSVLDAVDAAWQAVKGTESSYIRGAPYP